MSGKWKTNWWDMLRQAMLADGETFPPLHCTLPESEMRSVFSNGTYDIEGEPFTAWGREWVYFPLEREGCIKIGHAPRHPCDISLGHQ